MERPDTQQPVSRTRGSRLKRTGLLVLFVFCVLLGVYIFAYNFGLITSPQQVTIKPASTQNVTDVLLIMSHDENDSSTTAARDGVLDVMGRSSVGVDVVYMDAHHAPMGSDAHSQWASRVAQQVAQHGRYGAVICCDDEALYFIEYNHDTLFPSTPVIFFGINDINHALHAVTSGYMAGMIEQSYIGSTMQAASNLQPDATSFTAIVDNTADGQGDRGQFDLAMNSFDGMQVYYVNASTLSRSALGSSVANAGTDTVVFLLDVNNDLYGNVYSTDESVAYLTSVSSAPIYTASSGVGDGVAGSGYRDPTADGQRAASMTIDVLNGTRPSDLPLVLDGQLGYVFDNAVLDQYGVSASKVPIGSTVVNRNIFSLHTLYLLLVPIALWLVAVICLLMMRRLSDKNVTYATAVATPEAPVRRRTLPDGQSTLIYRKVPELEEGDDDDDDDAIDVTDAVDEVDVAGDGDDGVAGDASDDVAGDDELADAAGIDDDAEVDEVDDEIEVEVDDEIDDDADDASDEGADEPEDADDDGFDADDDDDEGDAGACDSEDPDGPDDPDDPDGVDDAQEPGEPSTTAVMPRVEYPDWQPSAILPMDELDEKLIEADVRSLVGIDVVSMQDILDSYGPVIGDRAMDALERRLAGVENTTFVLRKNEAFYIGFDAELARRSQELEFIEFVLRQSLVIDEYTIVLKTFIGVVNRQKGMDYRDMTVGLEFALDQACELGLVNSVVFYDINMRRAMEDHEEIQAVLEEAVENEDFIVFYQPQISLRDNDVSGYEALVRLRDKQYPPAQFIPVAEATGLIVDIDRIVVQRSIEQLAKWKRRNKRMRPISINFSSTHLTKDADFIDFLMDLLRKNEISPDYIRIEIDESLFSADAEKAEQFITKLFKAGITIALDHFGMGYTTFSDVMTVPASVVKIDRDFVDTFLVDGSAANFEQLVMLAQGFGKRVVVVGVDKKWQLDLCRELKCDDVQGYYFSKPLLPESAVQYKPKR